MRTPKINTQSSNRSDSEIRDKHFPTTDTHVLQAVHDFDIACQSITPTVKEIVYLKKLRKAFSISPQWANRIVAWARALESYGTPPSFFENARVTRHTFTVDDQQMECMQVINKGHLLRGDLTLAQEPYVLKQGPDDYPATLHLGDDGCKLCENIAQAFDTEKNPHEVGNVILDLGEAFFLPNRYPAVPFHCLWIPKNHDDPTFRAQANASSPHLLKMSSTPEHTRARILTEKDLAQVFVLADELELIAMRNHPLDAMTIPRHDHFQFVPESLYPNQVLDHVLQDISSSGSTFISTLDSTPFAALAIHGLNAAQTAAWTAPICEKLERVGQVWTIGYVKGVAILSPRRVDIMDNTRIAVGSGINFNLFSPSNAENILKYVPRKQEFD